jgi:hypothetical protein
VPKFFYEHLRDDADFAVTIHKAMCDCKDGSCGRIQQWRGEVVELSLSDFQEDA